MGAYATLRVMECPQRHWREEQGQTYALGRCPWSQVGEEAWGHFQVRGGSNQCQGRGRGDGGSGHGAG